MSTGKKLSSEQRAKLSRAKRKKVLTDEHKRKIGEGVRAAAANRRRVRAEQARRAAEQKE
jgi:hypothetical protein